MEDPFILAKSLTTGYITHTSDSKKPLATKISATFRKIEQIESVWPTEPPYKEIFAVSYQAATGRKGKEKTH